MTEGPTGVPLADSLGDGTSDRELVGQRSGAQGRETDRRRYSTADELRADLVLQGARCVICAIERREPLTRLGLAGGWPPRDRRGLQLVGPSNERRLGERTGT